MNKRRPSRTIFVVYGLGLLFGVGVLYWEHGEVERDQVSLQWPTVSGKILQSEEVYVPGHHSGGYRADVTYSYAVNDTRHVSRQISLWSAHLSGSGGIARLFVRNHPAGSTVQVHYNPVDPQHAVLVPGADLGRWRLFEGMGGLCTVASLFGFMASLRRRSRLVALLNHPAPESRVITMTRADVLHGSTLFGRNILFGFLSFALGMAILLPPLVTKPMALPGAPEMRAWQWFAGVACCLAAAFFVWRALRQGRRAECPLCGNFLNKSVLATARCAGCGARIAFDGPAPEPPTVPRAAA